MLSLNHFYLDIHNNFQWNWEKYEEHVQRNARQASIFSEFSFLSCNSSTDNNPIDVRFWYLYSSDKIWRFEHTNVSS